MSTTTRDDVAYELAEIQAEILDLIDRAKGALKKGGFTGALMRAESYWMAHVIGAVSNDHGYLGGSLISLQDTIDEIENCGDGDIEDEDDLEGEG